MATPAGVPQPAAGMEAGTAVLTTDHVISCNTTHTPARTHAPTHLPRSHHHACVNTTPAPTSHAPTRTPATPPTSRTAPTHLPGAAAAVAWLRKAGKFSTTTAVKALAVNGSLLGQPPPPKKHPTHTSHTTQGFKKMGWRTCHGLLPVLPSAAAAAAVAGFRNAGRCATTSCCRGCAHALSCCLYS